MIREISDIRKIACKAKNLDSPFLKMIRADHPVLKVFGDVRMYIAEKNGECNGALLDNRGSFTVFAGGDSHREEIESFLTLSGFTDVICDETITLNLDETALNHGYIMKYSHEKDPKTGDAKSVSSEEIKDLYPLLRENFENTGDYPEWLGDISHKMRHKASRAFAKYVEGKAVSCALSLHESDDTGFISGVCTEMKYRNRGYGKDCVLSLVSSLWKSGKKNIYLFCRDGDIAEYYGKIGFYICGGFNEYIRQTENR